MTDTIKILSDLIALQSDTHDKIKNIADYICNILNKHNILYQRIRHNENTAESIIAGINIEKLSDINSGILLSGHMDTVTTNAVLWTNPPFKATVSGNKIYGCGAVDMKYFIATVLELIPTMQGYKFPIILAFTGDEETDVYGIKHICNFMQENNIKPQMAIVGEPTCSKILVGHNGYCGHTTNIQGVAAHSSNINDGINSIYIASEIISHIKQLAEKYAVLGTTINVGTISGGTQKNTVPDKTTFEWDVRFARPEHLNEITQSVQEFINTILNKYSGANIKTDTAEFIYALMQNPDSKIADIIYSATNAEKIVSPIATEAGFLQSYGIDTVVFGTGDTKLAHTVNENISMDSLFELKNILGKILNNIV